MDDRPGYGVDEDVVVNAAGDGTDLIHGVEAWLHRLAWLLTLLCRRLLSGIVSQTQHFRASGSAAKTAYRSSVYKTSPNTVRSMALRISCIKTPPAA